MFLISCTSYTNEELIKKYGIEYNSVREKVGLEPIPNNFLEGFCTRKDDEVQINYLIDSTYFDKNKILIKSKVVRAIFIMKTVTLLRNEEIIEEDTYIHPTCHNTMSTEGKIVKVNNKLSFMYYFTNHDGWDKGWYYIRNNGSSGGISKSQADSIFHSWGLSRPTNM